MESHIQKIQIKEILNEEIITIITKWRDIRNKLNIILWFTVWQFFIQNLIISFFHRFTAGFCFTVVYAALLTKTNRISRIFNVNKHSAKRPSFISPKSQLIICSGLVSVQILINGVWIIIDPAKAMHHYPTREDNLLVCNSYIDASYMIAFTYPIILIVICTVYAILTRKIPEAFNESKHIGKSKYKFQLIIFNKYSRQCLCHQIFSLY